MNNTVKPPAPPDIIVLVAALPIIYPASPVIANVDPALKNNQQTYKDNVANAIKGVLEGSNRCA